MKVTAAVGEDGMVAVISVAADRQEVRGGRPLRLPPMQAVELGLEMIRAGYHILNEEYEQSKRAPKATRVKR